MESLLQLIGVLIIFVAVLFITYIVTKWMGGYTKAHSYNKNLKLVESIPVGNNKFVSIVGAGRKYFVISVGKDEVHLLGELKEEDLLELPEDKPSSGESFQEILTKMKGKFPNNK